MKNKSATAVVPVRGEPNAQAAPRLTVLPKGLPKKLDFGTAKPVKQAAASQSKYPVVPDPNGTLAKAASAFLDARDREEAAKGAKEAAREQLVAAGRPFYFSANAGALEAPSSVAVLSPDGEVRVTFKDAYKRLSEKQYAAVEKVIGPELAGTYLEQTFEFVIDSTKIPTARLQEVIDAVNEMTATLGISEAVTVKPCYQPNAEWHAARLRRLTPEQNLKLEQTVDSAKGFCQIAVGPARGRK